MIKTLNLLLMLALATVFSVTTLAVTDSQRAEIEARIKPVGEVCLEGDNSCGVVVATSAGARSGEDVYNAACMACHSTGVAGAPKVGDAAAWADRIGKGLDALYDSSINGLTGTGMIAKGGCMACTDEEVQAAVDYMLDGSR